jgi:hypothetical protein
MLRTQKKIDFAGGLDSRRLKDWIVEELRSLKIYQIWLACDSDRALPALQKAAEKLTPHFKRDKLRCYVLVGHNSEKIDAAEARLRRVWELGFLPFAMNYDQHYCFTKEWSSLIRNFSRPAVTKRIMNPKKAEAGLFK